MLNFHKATHGSSGRVQARVAITEHGIARGGVRQWVLARSTTASCGLSLNSIEVIIDPYLTAADAAGCGGRNGGSGTLVVAEDPIK